MPLPKPKKDEVKDDFLDRCMGDDITNEEYPDNNQRYAICNSLWKNKNKRGEEMAIQYKDIEIEIGEIGKRGKKGEKQKENAQKLIDEIDNNLECCYELLSCLEL